ncbi:MFS transporter [Bacillus gobiensis]|uniref:MFS transporter n=1 Tax=Bacillus gobiensis TaxID=1441095 RepID=UPI0006AFD041|nr:MFS transporter [Bacillus gobiensis]
MFIVLGLLGVIMTAVFWVYYKVPRQERESNETNKVPLKEVLANLELWKITIMWFAAGIVNWGLASWIPSYLMDSRGMDMMSMGFFAALPGISTGVAMLFSGWLIQRFIPNHEKYYAAIGMLVSAVFLYFMFTTQSLVTAMICMNICMVFKSFAFTVAFSLPHKMMPNRVIGSAMGIINMGAQAAGFISPLVMGFMIDSFGTYDAAFWFLIGVSVLSIVMALSIKKPSKVISQNQEIVIHRRSL